MEKRHESQDIETAPTVSSAPTVEPKPTADKERPKETRTESLLVTWDGPDDPLNPHNWPQTRKWAVTLLLSMGGLVTLMASAMMAPALAAIADDLGTSQASAQIFLSIFILAFAFGPMVLAPLAEVFGRRPVWLLSSCFFILWNTVSGFSNSTGLLIASRILGGIGASAEFAISRPVLSDCWTPSQRGKSLSISTFVPLLGPAIGPIVGGAVADPLGWRWMFWILSIFDALLVVMALFIFPETFSVIILRNKATKMRKATGIDYYIEADEKPEPLKSKLANSLGRPLRLLLFEPSIQVMSFFLAYNYGILFIVLSTFATLWIDRYGESETISGVHYVALVIGYTIASQVGARYMDKMWAYLQAKSREGDDNSPEWRVPLMVPGALLIPIGLFIYGWAAQARVHWIVPDIGICIFGCGIILNTQAMQAYVMDAYPKYVASAAAASQFLRSITGFAFPLFAPAMYYALGYGWGNSLLAFTFLGLGVPAPVLLWYYGAKLRAMGRPDS